VLVETVLRALDPLPAAPDGPDVSASNEEAATTDATAPPAVAFPPSVARWRELVDGEIAALRGTRGLHDAVTTELVLAVIAAESGGDPAAQSPARAVGLMQVLPATVAALVPSEAAGGRASAFDPPLNVRAGILYLDEAVRRHDGDVGWALAAYNAGIPASLRARTVGAPLWSESSRFVARVMAALPPGA
jgi:soluble lytic murein transglycosylase-like protein